MVERSLPELLELFNDNCPLLNSVYYMIFAFLSYLTIDKTLN